MRWLCLGPKEICLVCHGGWLFRKQLSSALHLFLYLCDRFFTIRALLITKLYVKLKLKYDVVIVCFKRLNHYILCKRWSSGCFRQRCIKLSSQNATKTSNGYSFLSNIFNGCGVTCRSMLSHCQSYQSPIFICICVSCQISLPN